MRFDEATKTFEISVGELAEEPGFTRIGSGDGEGWMRLGLGSEMHARILQDRCAANPRYAREVFLKGGFAIEDWTAVVVGRLDGCFQRESGQWIIEEFKTGFYSEDDRRAQGSRFERHRRQLLIYCLLWERLNQQTPQAALVYLDVASGRETAVSVDYNPEETAAMVGAAVARHLRDWRAAGEARARKAVAATHLPFPHQQPRPGQQQMIRTAQQAFEENEALLAEAPTGSGKTAAILFPALARGLADGKQVMFLTSKNLQQIMAVNALRSMNRDGAFRTIQLRSKEKMCANGQVTCHEDFCPYAKNYPEKMVRTRVLDRLLATQPHHDPDSVFAEARREEVCPFEVQLELAKRADAIVGDYNYVFDPGIALKNLEELKETLLVVDEAHNLPERARKIFSPELREDRIRAALQGLKTTATPAGSSPLRKMKPRWTHKSAQTLLSFAENETGGSDDLFPAMQRILSQALSLLEQLAGVLSENTPAVQMDPPSEAVKALWKQWEPLFLRYLAWKRDLKIVRSSDSVVEWHFEFQRFLTVLNLYGPDFACFVERGEKGLRLALLCLDPSRQLERTFREAGGAALVSATLHPLEQSRRNLGLQNLPSRALSLPPPFPRENRKVLILPQVKTTFAARKAHVPRIAQLIAEMARAVPGNVLALFPSYQFLTDVKSRLPVLSKTVLVQRPESTDPEREAILRQLNQSRAARLACLGKGEIPHRDPVAYVNEHIYEIMDGNGRHVCRRRGLSGRMPLGGLHRVPGVAADFLRAGIAAPVF